MDKFLIGALLLSVIYSCILRYENLEYQEQIKLNNVKIEEQSKHIEYIQGLYDEQLQDKDATISKLRNDVNNATRVRIKQVQNGNTAVKDRKADCELNRATAQYLINLTERGDKAIINLNKCIDAYNALK